MATQQEQEQMNFMVELALTLNEVVDTLIQAHEEGNELLFRRAKKTYQNVADICRAVNQEL